MLTKSEERLYKVLNGAHVTEKAVMSGDSNIHVFKVSVDSTKRDVQRAVEIIFDVKVSSVRTVNVSGKSKSFGRRLGERKDWKKAYVRLSDGYSLNLEVEA